MLIRLLLVLALSAAAPAQVTVTLGDYSAKLSAPGFSTLRNAEGDERCDIFWKGGEVLLLNGAMEDYEGPVVEGRVTVVHEHKGGPTILDADVSLPDGTGHVFYLSDPKWSGVPAKWHAWMDGQLANGPPLDSAPLATLAAVSALGPKPDVSNASVTGSPRVVWNRCDMLQAILIRWKAGLAPSPEQLNEFRRWTSDQYKRSHHYYSRAQGGRPWVALENPKSIIGFGYAAPGGFANTYSSKEFFGRDISSPGKPPKALGWLPEDEQHVTVDAVAADAMLFDSFAAKWHLWSVAEKQAGFMLKGDWDSIRAYGWVARCFAFTHLVLFADDDPLFAVGHVSKSYEPALLAKLKAHNGEAYGRMWSVLDTGKKCDHICVMPALTEAIEDYHYTGDPLSLTKGQSTWMTGILVLGLDRMIKDGGLDPAAQQEARAQILRCADFLLVTARGPGIDFETMLSMPQDPAGIFNDVAPMVAPIVHQSETSVKGTFASAIVPAVETLRQSYLKGEWDAKAIETADLILDTMDKENYWQGTGAAAPALYMLDSGWSSGDRIGWPKP